MKYRNEDFEVDAVQFEPTAPIPDWVTKAVKHWGVKQPCDGSWGYVQTRPNDFVHVFPGDWVVKFPDGWIDVYKDLVFNSLYQPSKGEDVVNEVSLLDIIQDLERRVASLETENHELRLRVYKRFSPDEYETIYQEVMKRTARDLRLNSGAKDRA